MNFFQVLCVALGIILAGCSGSPGGNRGVPESSAVAQQLYSAKDTTIATQAALSNMKLMHQQDEAATKIQAAQRKHAAQTQLLEVQNAATTIQAVARRHAAQTQLLEAKNAATTIQAAQRKHAAQNNLIKAKNAATTIQAAQRRHAAQTQLLEARNAAITIQAAARRHAAQTNLKKAKNAAITIQAAQRRHAAQTQLLEAKNAATTIQAAQRRHAAQTQLLEAKNAAITIQAAARRHTAQTQLLKAKDAATTIQAAARRHAAQTQLLEARNAAITIQAAQRRHTAQTQLLKAKNAAITIQAAAKRHAAQTQLLEARNAAITIQAAARRHTAQTQLLKAKDAATTIQAAARRHAAQTQLLEARNAAITIQAAQRRHTAQTNLKKAKNAAITIQTAQREFNARKLLQQQDAAATKIQAAARRNAAQTQLLKAKDAATTIQAAQRGFSARKLLQQQKRDEAAAITVQTAIREALARKRKQQDEAAIKIQAAQRRHAAQNNLKKAKNAAITIQATQRRHAAQTQLLEARNAAITIQAAQRGFSTRKLMHQQDAAATKIQAAHRGFSTRKLMQQQDVLIKRLTAIIQAVEKKKRTKILAETLKEYKKLKELNHRTGKLCGEMRSKNIHELRKIQKMHSALTDILAAPQYAQLGQMDAMKAYLRKIKTAGVVPPEAEQDGYIQEEFPYIVNTVQALLNKKQDQEVRASLENTKQSLSSAIEKYTKNINHVFGSKKHSNQENNKLKREQLARLKQRISEKEALKRKKLEAATKIQAAQRGFSAKKLMQQQRTALIKRLTAVIQAIEKKKRTKILAETLEEYKKLEGTNHIIEKLCGEMRSKNIHELRKIQKTHSALTDILAAPQYAQLGQMDAMKAYLRKIETAGVVPPEAEQDGYIQEKFPYIVNTVQALLNKKQDQEVRASLENTKQSLSSAIEKYTKNINHVFGSKKHSNQENNKLKREQLARLKQCIREKEALKRKKLEAATKIQAAAREALAQKKKQQKDALIKRLTAVIHAVEKKKRTKILAETLEEYKKLEGTNHIIEKLCGEMRSKNIHELRKIQKIHSELKDILAIPQYAQMRQMDAMKEYLRKIETAGVVLPEAEQDGYIQEKFPYIVNTVQALLNKKQDQEVEASLKYIKQSLSSAIEKYTKNVRYVFEGNTHNSKGSSAFRIRQPTQYEQRINKQKARRREIKRLLGVDERDKLASIEEGSAEEQG